MFEQDQAAGLRQLFPTEHPDVIVAFGAAKAQASLTAALARSMVRDGAGLLIIDGCAGAIAQQFGRRCRYELGHVLAGDKTLAEVMCTVEPGLTLLPALRGLDQLARLPAGATRELRGQFAQVFSRKGVPIDAILINTRPLSAVSALQAFSASAALLLVLEPGVEGLTLAYQELKALRQRYPLNSCDVILAGDQGDDRARAAFDRLASTTRTFLGIELMLQRRCTPAPRAGAERRATSTVRSRSRLPEGSHAIPR